MPVVGRTDIALDWQSTPAVAIKTVAVSQMRFCDVDESFALAEGENDDLYAWQKGHKLFFERNGGFTEEMILLCERFELVHDFKAEN